MFYVYYGSDRKKAREAMNKKIASVSRGARVVRVTDAHTEDDLKDVLQSGQDLFGEERVIVLEDTCANEAMRPTLLAAFSALRDADRFFFMLEEKPDAELSRVLKKYANEYATFNAPKEGKDASVFALANALRSGNKKALWLGFQRELLKGKAPEALHGVLFWAAKDLFLKGGTLRAAGLVALLAELPHEARRKGVELEYALERFALSGA